MICDSSKYPFPSLKAANATAKKMRRKHKERQNNVHAYRCKVCGSWHLGRALTRPNVKRQRPIADEEELYA